MNPVSAELATRVRPSRRGQPHLRIAFIANSLARGGAEGQLVLAARGLRHRGHEVHVASLLDWPGYQDELRTAGVQLEQLSLRPPPRSVGALYSGVAFLRRVRPDIVISFDYQANLLGRLAGQAARVPVVVSSIRGSRFGGSTREVWIRATDRLATLTTTNSERVARDLVARRLVRADRIAVVPNAFVRGNEPPPDRRSDMRCELGLGESDFLWVAVGNLRRGKGHGDLLRAVAAASQSGASLHLAVAGDGDDQPFRRQAEALELTSRVSFLGWRDDIADLLAAADGLVSASRSEGLPNAAIEALASQVPVVATRAGGTQEVVRDGRTGLLVHVGDHQALAAAMCRLMAMPAEQRHEMGRHGRQDVEGRHDLGRVIDRWEQLLYQAARGRVVGV